MSLPGVAPRLDISPYEPRDEGEVIELLSVALGPGPAGARTPEFLLWKHAANPAGSSVMLVARADGDIVGLRFFMRWRLRAGETIVSAARAVDTATHPRFRRAGIFSHLTRDALEILSEEVDFVFNTPNSQSMPGYIKLGWKVVGRVPVSIRVRHPLRFARGLRSVSSRDDSRWSAPAEVPSAADVLDDNQALAPLLEQIAAPAPRLTTVRDPAYLHWRYGEAPHLGYRAVAERRADKLVGLAIFRLRSRGRLREAALSDLLVRPGDVATARHLAAAVSEACGADHVICTFPSRSTQTRAVARCGFVRAPSGMTLVARQVRGRTVPDPCNAASWALTLGDLEVF